MRVDYDKRADVLYITFRAAVGGSRYVETGQGQILKIEKSSCEVVGVTIPLFSRRIGKGQIEIPGIGKVFSSESIEELVR